MPIPKRFTDREAAALLRLAAERQAGANDASGDGLTVADLEKVADELGIDRTHLHAVLTQSRAESDWQTRILGSPERDRGTRIVPGTLTRSAWDQLVQGLNAEHGRFHTSEFSVGQGYWSSDKVGKLTVMATQTPNGVRLDVTRYIDDIAAYGLIGTIVSAFVGVSLALSLPIESIAFRLIVGVAVVGSVYSIVRAGLQRYFRKERVRSEAILDQLERALGAATIAPPAPTPLFDEPDVLRQNLSV